MLPSSFGLPGSLCGFSIEDRSSGMDTSHPPWCVFHSGVCCWFFGGCSLVVVIYIWTCHCLSLQCTCTGIIAYLACACCKQLVKDVVISHPVSDKCIPSTVCVSLHHHSVFTTHEECRHTPRPFSSVPVYKCVHVGESEFVSTDTYLFWIHLCTGEKKRRGKLITCLTWPQVCCLWNYPFFG